MASKKVVVTPAEVDDLQALVREARRIADALEVGFASPSKLIICGARSLDGVRCLRPPGHHPATPHANVVPGVPVVWADRTAAASPPSAADVARFVDPDPLDEDAGGTNSHAGIPTADLSASPSREGVGPSVSSPALLTPPGAPGAPSPRAAATLLPGDAPASVAAAPPPPSTASMHGAEVAALVADRERLVAALGAELATRVAALGDVVQDPVVALAVKVRGGELLGDDGFKAARARIGLKAGACPTGADLRRFALEALAPAVEKEQALS